MIDITCIIMWITKPHVELDSYRIEISTTFAPKQTCSSNSGRRKFLQRQIKQICPEFKEVFGYALTV